jgi:hypothetical protein
MVHSGWNELGAIEMLRTPGYFATLLTSISVLLACSEPDSCGGRRNVRAGSFEISNSSPDQLSDLECAEVITGDLRIWEDVDSLASLSELVHVMGDLKISSSRLESLTGLERLQEVGGSLEISSTHKLKSIEALASLQQVGGNLLLRSLHELRSLDGLGALSSIGGDLEITDLDVITDLSPFESLASIGGSFSLMGNDKLEAADFGPEASTSGGDRYPSVGGTIYISTNPSLKKLVGFGSPPRRLEPCDLTALKGESDVSVYANENLTEVSLGGFWNLCIEIVGNPRLSTVSTTSFDTYGGSLELRALPQLSSVMFPDHMHTLWIEATGLETLEVGSAYVRCALHIEGNSALHDISSLAREPRSRLETRLHVVDNPALATCKVQALAEALPAPSGTHECGAAYPLTRQVTISGNNDAAVCE